MAARTRLSVTLHVKYFLCVVYIYHHISVLRVSIVSGHLRMLVSDLNVMVERFC
jgi:hypothetical protein